MMFRGYNKPGRKDIFGPSNDGPLYMRGGGHPWADHRQDSLYMRGEGLGSMLGSLFRRIIPAATKAVKTIAGSKIVQETGKQALDSGINALTNAAANTISGDKTAGEAFSDELKNARKEIGSALKKAGSKRSQPSVHLTPTKRKKKKAGKIKRRRMRPSVFDDDDD